MAKRFRFRLEPVLKLRRHREDDRRRALGEAARKVLEQGDALLLLLREEMVAKSQRAGLKTKQIDILKIRLHEQYLASLTGRIRAAIEELRRLREREEEVRRELVEARRQVRVLELLEERRRNEHDLLAAREERKELDEVSLNVYRKSS